MRPEATDAEWKQLYQLGLRFQKQKAWEWLTPKDLIALSRQGSPSSGPSSFTPSGSATPLPASPDPETVYVSVSGNDGYSCGFSLFLGTDGLNGLFGLWEGEELEIEPEYLLARQDTIQMICSDEGRLPSGQEELPSRLGLPFEENGWIYFERLEPGYAPSPLNQTEVRLCTYWLEMLLEALKQHPRQFPEGYQPGKVLYHYASAAKQETAAGQGSASGQKAAADKGKAELPPACFKKSPLQQFQLPFYAFTDSKQLWVLQNTKQTKAVWEMDYCPFSREQEQEGFDRPVLPWAFLLADHTERLALAHCLVWPGDAPDASSRRLFEQILDRGRPKEIAVPNAFVRSQIAGLCEAGSIQVTIDDTSCCWRRLAELEQEAKRLADYQEASDTEKAYWSSLSYQEQELKSRQQKIQVVKDFFGQGDLPPEKYEAIEKSIEAAWCKRSFRELVLESSRSKLLELLSRLRGSFHESATKEELADRYIDQFQDLFFHFRLLVEQQPRNLLERLYEELHADDIPPNQNNTYYQNLGIFVKMKQSGWPLEDFYYSMDHVLELFDRSLLDIGLLTREHDWVLVLKLFPEMDSLMKSQFPRWH